MRRFLTLFCLTLFLTLIPAPKAFSQVELFGGYSNQKLSGAPSGVGPSANGWAASAYLHLLGPFGVEGDLSNHYGISTPPTSYAQYYVPQFTEMWGPRFTLALPRIHPFVHALFGTVHGVPVSTFEPALSPSPPVLKPENAFGMAFGGGLDVRATTHVWLRLVQVDYVRAQFTNNTENQTQISTGLVFRFGNW
jgi:hypothetical protein